MINRLLLTLAIAVIAMIACSQPNQQKKDVLTDSYAGSTPCNRTVNAMLRIPATDTCAYMRWQLNLFDKDGQEGSFTLLISYGDYLPNTMLFLGGGKSITLSGKLTSSHVTRNQSKYRIYHLAIYKEPELLLIEMDKNILHLIGANNRLVKGDDGHGFVLNRLPSN